MRKALLLDFIMAFFSRPMVTCNLHKVLDNARLTVRNYKLPMTGQHITAFVSSAAGCSIKVYRNDCQKPVIACTDKVCNQSAA